MTPSDLRGDRNDPRGDDVSAQRLHAALAPFAADLAAGVDGADDPAAADACAVLAALARGDDPPQGAARREVERAEGEE